MPEDFNKTIIQSKDGYFLNSKYNYRRWPYG